MKMMDMTHHDAMVDEGFQGVSGAPAALSDAGDSDHSLASSTASTQGRGQGTATGRTPAQRQRGAASLAGSTSTTTTTSHTHANNNSKMRVQLPASCDPPQPSVPTKPLVWIVFGGTGHMGRSLVKSALAHGDYVTTVGRTNETTPAAMQALAASAAEQPGVGAAMAGGSGGEDSSNSSPSAAAAGKQRLRCLGALCDVRARDTVDRVVQRTLKEFGRIDVVANCSGYGVVGACEDQDEYELRNQFETNFMGTLHILQATLPILRRQEQENQQRSHGSSVGGGGRYLIFSSTAGALGVPGLGPYCSTKYAVEGLIEAMLYEVDAFNIKATLVEPGLMRRDDHMTTGTATGAGTGTGTTVASRGGASSKSKSALPTWGHFLIKPPSEPYADASSPALHTTRMVQWLGDRQPASVVQCAELVWQLAHCSFPPLRLPLGSYAIESIRDRLRSVTEELEDWKHLNFPLPPEVAATSSSSTATATADASTGKAASGRSGDDEEMADMGR